MLLNLVPPLYIFFHIHNTLKIQLYDGVPNVNVYVCMKTGYFWVLQQTIDIFSNLQIVISMQKNNEMCNQRDFCKLIGARSELVNNLCFFCDEDKNIVTCYIILLCNY